MFKKLFKKEIIDEKMFSILKEMRGFRHILVHEYAAVDDELVFEILQTRISDFENLMKTILEFIKTC